eukprot:scaffold3447_cov93-Skeletonema_dohrnii-CCMP3373.AAC.3
MMLEGKLEHCEILIRMLMSVESSRSRSKVAARKEETKQSHGDVTRPDSEELVIIMRARHSTSTQITDHVDGFNLLAAKYPAAGSDISICCGLSEVGGPLSRSSRTITETKERPLLETSTDLHGPIIIIKHKNPILLAPTDHQPFIS